MDKDEDIPVQEPILVAFAIVNYSTERSVSVATFNNQERMLGMGYLSEN